MNYINLVTSKESIKMNFNMNGMNGLMNNRMNQFSMNSSQYSLSELGSSFNDNFNSTAPQANSQQNFPPEEGQYLEDIQLLNLAQDQVLSELSDLSKEEEPPELRKIFQEQDQLCLQKDIVLDSLLEVQGDVNEEQQNQLAVIDLVERYLKNLGQVNKEKVINYANNKQLHKLQHYQKKEPGTYYTLYQTPKYPKIEVLTCEPGYRSYKVYIDRQCFTVSAVSLNLSFKEVSAHIQPNKSLKSILKQILTSSTRITKIQRIQNTHTESLSDILTNIAMLKYYRRIHKKNQNLLNNQFQFDVIVFKDYVMLCCDRHEKIAEGIKKIQQLVGGEYKFVREFIRQLKILLKFKEMLFNMNYQEVEKYLKQHKDQQIYFVLSAALINHGNYLKTLNPIPQDYNNLLPLLKPQQIPQNTKQITKILHNSVKFQTQQYTQVELAQSLNPIHIKPEQSYLLLILKLFKGRYTKSGFINRFVKCAKIPKKYNSQQEELLEEQRQQSQSVMMKLRQIMLLFANELKQLKPTLLYELLSYFSAIGDQLTYLNLQQRIIQIYINTPNKILKLFQFYLSYKLSPIFLDFFLHNHYIQRIQSLDLKEGINNEQLMPVLEKERQICLGVMREIKFAVTHKEFDKINKNSDLYQQYCGFVTEHGEMLGKDMYEDVIVILKNIYERNLLVFTKEDQVGLAYEVMLEQYFTFSNRIKNPFLRSSLMKVHYYLVLYNTNFPIITKLKQILNKIPPLYRYNSIYWIGFSQTTRNFQLTQSIIKSSYLKLLNESPANYSTDLTIIIQIILKLNSEIYEHQKFKFQVMMKCIDKLEQNVAFEYNPNQENIMEQKQKQANKSNNNEIALLIKITNELMYSCTRQNIYKLDEQRKMTCFKIAKKYKPILEKYKQEKQVVGDQQKNLYLHARIMHVTLLLCEGKKKKQILPILKDLLAKYPSYFALLYYFLKVKYCVSYEDKKPLKKIIFENFKQFVKEKNLKIFKIIVTNEYILDQIQEIIHGSLKVEAMHFINDFSRAIYELSDRLPPSDIDNFIYSQFKHFLNKEEVPQEQTHCSYRTVTQILVEKEKVTFDSDLIHERVVKLSALLKNPYLGYALFQCLEGKKAILPPYEENPMIYHVINRALGKFKSDEFIDKFRAILYNNVKEREQTILNSKAQGTAEIKKLTKRISLLDKKSCFLSAKSKSWLVQAVERLDKQQQRQMKEFKEAPPQPEIKPRKYPKTGRHISKSFKKLHEKFFNISENMQDPQQGKKGGANQA